MATIDVTPIAASTTETDDATLVARARAGDLDSFSAIMRRYNRRVFRAARSVVRSDAAAEDSAQNAWLAAFERLETWDPARGGLGTWLASIAVHDALGQHRRAASRARTLDGLAQAPNEHEGPRDTLPEAEAHRAELRKVLEAAVDALPDDLRQALVLRDVEELSGAEAAQILGVTELTVRLRLFRARRALRASLDDLVEDGVAQLFGFDGERCDRIVARVSARVRERLS